MNEDDIIRKAQKDIKYFEPLYNRYFDPIFRFLYRKTSDEQEAADLTSRVFMLAMKNIGKYEIRGFAFSAWLYKIASNESNKHFRDLKRQRLNLEIDKLEQIMVCDVDNAFEGRWTLIQQLIAELNDTEVKILELKFFENKNFAEIAFIMDQKESTVKMKLYRSLDKLKQKYEALKNQGR